MYRTPDRRSFPAAPCAIVAGCGRILKITRRVAVALFANKFEQFVIAGAIVHAEGFFRLLSRASGLSRRAAFGII
jgi:hypothetical protein